LHSSHFLTAVPHTQDYVPTVFENLVTTVPSPLDPAKNIEISLWDTAGQEDFDRLRPLSYNDTDVVLVVFAVNARNSYLNVTDKVGRDTLLYRISSTPADPDSSPQPQWYPEISHFCPTTPIILVLTKSDIRQSTKEKNQLQSQGQTFVSYEEGMALAKEIGAKKFMECSAKEQTVSDHGSEHTHAVPDNRSALQGVNEVFDAAMRETLKGVGGISIPGWKGGVRRRRKGCVVL
jgi:Rho family, other